MLEDLPDIAAVLSQVLGRVPRDDQPLLIAYAERLAAKRYRVWADRVGHTDERSGLLACAAREETIAERIEELYPNAEATQQSLLAANPDLLEINAKLFEPLSLERQFELQAQGERLGAATWRSFAAHAGDAKVRETFLACAPLEEENAAFLESIVSGSGRHDG